MLESYCDGLWELGALVTVPLFIIEPSFLEGYPLSWVYSLLVLATIGSYQLARHLFIKNPMENNGEVLMFGGLEGIFKFGVAVCFALLIVPLTVYRNGIDPLSGLVGYPVAGVVFWLLVTWLIRWRKVA